MTGSLPAPSYNPSPRANCGAGRGSRTPTGAKAQEISRHGGSAGESKLSVRYQQEAGATR